MVSLQGQVVAAATEEPKKLWGGRFTGETDPLMEKFNESLPMDRRMYAEDIKVIPSVLVHHRWRIGPFSRFRCGKSRIISRVHLWNAG